MILLHLRILPSDADADVVVDVDAQLIYGGDGWTKNRGTLFALILCQSPENVPFSAEIFKTQTKAKRP